MATKLRLIILGAPGSGKGTISSRITNEFKLVHLSSGDILRSNIEKKTELGLKVKDLVSKGHLVPDDIITKLIIQELKKIKCSWLLDGFPRSLNQVKALENEKIAIDRIINLQVPFEEIINRLKHRWVHPPSGRVYNLEFNPPKFMRKDDLTGEPLIQRPDDNEDVVKKRLNIYSKQIKPILDFYQSNDLVETFTGRTSNYLWPIIRQNLIDLKNSKEISEIEIQKEKNILASKEPVTHTGQKYSLKDYRKIRFEGGPKLVNRNFAIDLIKEDPVVVCDQRVIWSSGGGPLGHPKIFINLSNDEIHDCQYSGRKFIMKKYYDPSKHGKSIEYKSYLQEMKKKEFETFA